MYLSRMTLYTSQLLPSQLLHLVERGEYVMHQWLWMLFPGSQERQFLYRREELQGAFRFFVLSKEAPAKSDIFQIECRPFDPVLSAGQALSFSLRANPTVCKGGKRHDLLMEAKRQARGQSEEPEIWPYQQQVAEAWLARQGDQYGFSLREVRVDAYRQQQVASAKMRRMIQFSNVDYSGVLVVNDPALFLLRMTQGYGKSRAFGCGLMMIKPGDAA